MECPVCAGLVPHEAVACPHCGSAIVTDVHSASDETLSTPGQVGLNRSGASAVEDEILGPYRVAWPSTFFAVIVAGVVTIGIAFVVGRSPSADQFDDVVGNYLSRHEIDVVTPQSAAPRSLPHPPTSGYVAVETANRTEPGGPLATRSGEARAQSTSLIDIAAIALVAVAIFHGIWVGVLRETLSLAVLCAVAFAMRVWVQPFANWLQNPVVGPGVRYDLAPWLAGALIGVGAFALAAPYVYVMRQGARAVGRGAIDRLGGAAVGVAVGMLAAVVLLFVTRGLLGPTHELVASSHAFALLERSEGLADIREPASPDVASPPLGR